jgi:hypothetical protein
MQQQFAKKSRILSKNRTATKHGSVPTPLRLRVEDGGLKMLHRAGFIPTNTYRRFVLHPVNNGTNHLRANAANKNGKKRKKV